MEWTEPVQKLFLQHCAWHKKFHENVIECKKVGDQITMHWQVKPKFAWFDFYTFYSFSV